MRTIDYGQLKITLININISAFLIFYKNGLSIENTSSHTT